MNSWRCCHFIGSRVWNVVSSSLHFTSNLSKAFSSKLWRVVQKVLPILLSDLALEASLTSAKQAKLGCIVTLCHLKGRATTKLVYLSLKCFFMVFLTCFFFSSYDFFVCMWEDTSVIILCVCVCVPKNLLPCSQSKNLLPNDSTLFTTFLPSILLPKNLLLIPSLGNLASSQMLLPCFQPSNLPKCCCLVSCLVSTCCLISNLLKNLLPYFQPSQKLDLCVSFFPKAYYLLILLLL